MNIFVEGEGVTSRFSDKAGEDEISVQSPCVVYDALSPASSASAPKHVIWQAAGHAPTVQNGLGIFSQTCTTFSLMHMDSGGGSTRKGGH